LVARMKGANNVPLLAKARSEQICSKNQRCQPTIGRRPRVRSSWRAIGRAAGPPPIHAVGRSLFSVGEDATRGACDVVGVNVGPGEEFVARSGAWHAADGKMRERQVCYSSSQERFCDC